MSKTLSQKDIKVLGLSSLGGTLEFYDFIIFVFFANYISTNFFPKDLSNFWRFSLGVYVFFLAIVALLCTFIFSYLNNTQRTYSQ
ncbi:hypothetical protein FWB53_08825 [Campylobacter jejuni]|nr:hypothetical protein [Campylobacter jejuni]RTJ45844.1 hypothetical protein C3H70_07105 [Campylobacter jejuni]